MTSPAKLMSDLGCAISKREMCVLLNDPDAVLKNIRRHLGSEKKYGRAAANIIYEDLCHFSCCSFMLLVLLIYRHLKVIFLV